MAILRPGEPASPKEEPVNQESKTPAPIFETTQINTLNEGGQEGKDFEAQNKEMQEQATAEEKRLETEKREKAKEELSQKFLPLFKVAEPKITEAPKFETTQINTLNEGGQEGKDFEAQNNAVEAQKLAEVQEQKATADLERSLLSKKAAELYQQATGEELKPKVREAAILKAEAQGLKVMKVSEFLEKRRPKAESDIRKEFQDRAVDSRWEKVKSQYASKEEYKNHLESQRKELEKKGFPIPTDVFYEMVGDNNSDVEGIKKLFWGGKIRMPRVGGGKLEDFSKNDFEARMQSRQNDWNEFIKKTATERLTAVANKGVERMKGFRQSAAKEIIGDVVSGYEAEKSKKPIEEPAKKVEVAQPEAAKAEEKVEAAKTEKVFSWAELNQLAKKAEANAVKLEREAKASRVAATKARAAADELKKKGSLSARTLGSVRRLWNSYFGK